MRKQPFFSLFVLLLAAMLAGGLSACAPAAPVDSSAAVQASAEAAIPATAVAQAALTAAYAPATATATIAPTPQKTANPQAAAAQRTATAEVAQTATQAALTADLVAQQMLLNQFHEDKSLTLRPGEPIYLADFSQSLAQAGTYRWWEMDKVEPLANYVILSHIVWQYPDELSYLDAGSCGFIMRLVDGDRHIVALLSTTNTLSVSQKRAGGYVKAGILAPWGRFNDQIRTRENTGEADIAIVAERERISLYINGYKDSEWVVAHYVAGKIGYMIRSDSSVGYGIQCSFSNTTVFPLLAK